MEPSCCAGCGAVQPDWPAGWLTDSVRVEGGYWDDRAYCPGCRGNVVVLEQVRSEQMSNRE